MKQEQLESQSHQSYKSSDSGGMVAYIDKFQSTMAQLETISPAEYPDMRKKDNCCTISDMLKEFPTWFKGAEMKFFGHLRCVLLI